MWPRRSVRRGRADGGKRRRRGGDGAAGRYRDPLSAGLVALGLFSPGFLTLVTEIGLLRPGYDMVSDQVSALGLGTTAGAADAAFVSFGVLLCLFAAGLWRSFRRDRAARRGALWLALAGVCLALLAAFATDTGIKHVTVHGLLHDTCVGLVALGFLGGCHRFRTAFARDPRWKGLALYTRATTIATPAIWLAWGLLGNRAPFNPTPPLMATAGLIQRCGILVMTAWIAVVAVHHSRLVWEARRRWRSQTGRRPATGHR